MVPQSDLLQLAYSQAISVILVYFLINMLGFISLSVTIW